MENFGCRASQADGDAIAARLEALGAFPADGLPQTDVVVVNTCSVTAEADRDARAYIRRVQRANPEARIVVTGCYAQRAPEEVAALPGVFAVVGNSHKNHVASIALAGSAGAAATQNHGFVPLASLRTATTANTILPAAPAYVAAAPFLPFLLIGDIFAHSDFQLPSLPASVVERLAQSRSAHRTRPSLKIQDGCGNRCAFCVIPSTRGNSRSLPRQQVLDAVREFTTAGGQELVISGINLGRWGRDLAPRGQHQDRFEYLLAEIFETTALPRLRISSVEPMDWTDGLISLLPHRARGTHPRLARHAHVPLQSGSDSVLRRMHRRYRPWHYAERLAKIRAACPDAAIGADVMVGFPGETEQEFQESYDFIAAQPLTYLHLFPFSARPGTAGWELHRQSPVPTAAVQERMAALRELIDRKNLAFRSKCIGKQLSAVTLVTAKEPSARPQGTRSQSNRTAAMTDNFLPVEIAAHLEPNTLVTVHITSLTTHGLSGTISGGIRPIA